MNDQSDDEFDHDDLVESKVSIIWRQGKNPMLPHSFFFYIPGLWYMWDTIQLYFSLLMSAWGKVLNYVGS